MKKLCQFCKKKTKSLICYEDSRIGGELALCMDCYHNVCEGLFDLKRVTMMVKPTPTSNKLEEKRR